MAEVKVLPRIFVTSDGTRSPSPVQSPAAVDWNGSRAQSVDPDKKTLSNGGKSLPNKLIRSASPAGHGPLAPEAGRSSQAAIDPLSQHIIQRIQPESMTVPRTRTGSFPLIKSEPSSDPMSSTDPTATGSDSIEAGNKDKRRKGFLERFIGSKKKEITPDGQEDDADIGDRRAEGTDADVFSHPIGFIPKYPAPPKYIKVRSRGKKEKDFNRVFLAQQLRGRTGVEIAQAGGRSVGHVLPKPASTGTDGFAIWAMGFSMDGKYLAAGGHDRIVRVWQVIANEEDRRSHEKEEDAASKNGQSVRLSAPVFKTRPVQEYEGHTASILDLSWSKNNFLLSSSMDKTVRLWHVTRTECLCCFKHTDFVTSIQFHPRDDRFFLAGSLDSKLRLWSIPDKSVAYSAQLPDLVTAVAFSPDGKTCIAGCLNGLCLFYDTENLKYQTQMHVRSAHGKNAKGSKITGIQTILYPPDDPKGETKILISSNDSRVRVYNLRDKNLELKLKGNENNTSQIHATFSDDAKYVICGSEDKKAYIWPTAAPDKDKDRQAVELFEAHDCTVTQAIFAPKKTRQLLQTSGDPLFELCNPPPVVLSSRVDSHTSHPPTENGHQHADATPSMTPVASLEEDAPQIDTYPHISLNSAKTLTRPECSPAFLSRSTHPGGSIIVTADYMGHISVFRQDCAYAKRLRAETFSGDSASTYRKVLNRSSSVRTNRSSLKGSPHTSQSGIGSDRILSWRQSVGSVNGSVEGFGSSRPSGTFVRAPSPRKSTASSRGSGLGLFSKGSTRSSSLREQGLGISTTNTASTNATNTTGTSSIATTSAPPSPEKGSVDDLSATNQVRHVMNSAQGAKLPTVNGDRHGKRPMMQANPSDPLLLRGDQSYMFWDKAQYNKGNDHSLQRISTTTIEDEGGSMEGRKSRGRSVREGSEGSRASLLSDEVEGKGEKRRSRENGGRDRDKEEEVVCACGSDRFKAKVGRAGKELVCADCGKGV